MNQYSVSGRFEARDGWETFQTEVEAENDNVAEEYVYSNFGSKHGLKRRQIEIDEVAQ